ncbi:hypothetical protein EMCRGX_G009603 [Ephydatia muelleri]
MGKVFLHEELPTLQKKNLGGASTSESKGLLDEMLTLETGICCVFWNEILDRFAGTSQTLQSATLDLNNAVAALQSLRAFVEDRRNAFNKYEAEASKLSGCTTYSQSFSRVRKRNVRLNPLDYGHGPEAEMSPSQKFKVESFLPVIDKLIICLNQRLQAYDKVTDLFGFLHRLDTADSAEIEEATKKLLQVYPGDLETCLSMELIQFAEFIKLFIDNAALESTVSKEQQFYKLLWEKEVRCTFPNVDVLLRIYLVLMISNCNGERSFSKLKLIKNRLRTSLGQEKLNQLTIMNIEYDVMREIDFEHIVADFSKRKARKVLIFLKQNFIFEFCY